MISSRIFTSCTLPSVMRINVGILPRRSNKVCILTAALCLRNLANRLLSATDRELKRPYPQLLRCRGRIVARRRNSGGSGGSGGPRQESSYDHSHAKELAGVGQDTGRNSCGLRFNSG